ncbi:hypothetical protein [Amycolatopsis cihanbeyliensis]
MLKTTVTDDGEPSDALDDLPTAQAAVVVNQAISAISLAIGDPQFPAEVIGTSSW